MTIRELNNQHSLLNNLTPNTMQTFYPATVYLSGKITGMPNLNKFKFEAAEKHLTQYGYDVINPHKLPDNHDKTWESYMKECTRALTGANMVVVLDCWKKSRGAVREVMMAIFLGIPVVDIETMRDVNIPFSLKIKLLFNTI